MFTLAQAQFMNDIAKEFVSNGYIILHDGSKIKELIDGISCSHNTFKMICVKCMQHYSKDFKLRQAFYEINRQYLERKFG